MYLWTFKKCLQKGVNDLSKWENDNRLKTIKEITWRIEANKRDLEELTEIYIKAFSPKKYKGSTSYNDYDTIPGGNKELGIIDYKKEKERLETLITLDQQIINSLSKEVETEAYLKLLNNNVDKVKFLRKVAGYSQVKTAEILEINERHVKRLENKLNE